MSGQLKEVRIRIKSVQSTQQITKAMKMVSAAKLRKATERIIRIRPFANKLNEMLSNIAAGSDVSIPLANERAIKNVLLVLVTSDRGLAGAFSSTLVKLTRTVMLEKYPEQSKAGRVTIMPVGMKGFDGVKKMNVKLKTDFVNLFQTHDFQSASKAAEWLIEAFEQKEFDAIEIIYSQFKNAATQIYTTERFLPIIKSSGPGSTGVNFIFEPDQEQLVNELTPRVLKTQFFKVLLDSNASEHGARMTAMDKATENANDILKDLSVKYNRARQAAITTELSEIVGGAAALQG